MGFQWITTYKGTGNQFLFLRLCSQTADLIVATYIQWPGHFDDTNIVRYFILNLARLRNSENAFSKDV